ncbi:MAG: hypothetical protein QRY16_14040 [Enterobacterales bacterium endosymbiont of Blomia tropicalis]|uniref:hypothetical protein n=1 Tax=Mixta mediterraneensis TaxID=2758443 RepID=UPI0025A811E2|nr:hypothetical protein [Mixta mediterraneensis]MDL4914865.1 hypothetical protein [Mixta mediterraneensis]
MPALRSTGDSRGITLTVTEKGYIKIKKDAWIKIGQSKDFSYRFPSSGKKPLSMDFDENKKKWNFPGLNVKA